MHTHAHAYITHLSQHDKYSWGILENNRPVWRPLHRLKIKDKKGQVFVSQVSRCVYHTISLCQQLFYIIKYTLKTIGSIVHIRDELDGLDPPSPIHVAQVTDTEIPPVASALLGPELKMTIKYGV